MPGIILRHSLPNDIVIKTRDVENFMVVFSSLHMKINTLMGS